MQGKVSIHFLDAGKHHPNEVKDQGEAEGSVPSKEAVEPEVHGFENQREPEEVGTSFGSAKEFPEGWFEGSSDEWQENEPEKQLKKNPNGYDYSIH